MERPWLKHYAPYARPHLEYPQIPLFALLDQAASRMPDNTAIIFMGTQITYRQLKEMVDRLATALRNIGVKPGERVAVMLPNCPQAVIAYYGVLKAGAVLVEVNPLYTERELRHILGDAGASTLIFLDILYPKVDKVAKELNIERLIVTRLQDYMPLLLRFLYPWKMRSQLAAASGLKQRSDIFDFKQLINAHPPQPPTVTVDAAKDVALLLYTGGTTGLSKAAMLTHLNLVANVVQLREFSPEYEEGREIIIGVLPFFHSYGMTTVMNMAVYTCSTMVLIPRFDVETILKQITKYRATLFPGTPTMYVALLQHPDLKKYNISSLKACMSGAAPLPLEVQQKFESSTGGLLMEGYGLTECSPVTHACIFVNDFINRRKPGSIGIPVPDTDCKIVDLETGTRELPPGEPGELCIKGPQVMLGYWNRPEETAQVLRDGWLHTGDIARMDEDGFFYIVDRKKDLVIAGGYNIYPREVEEVLYEHPKIKEAVVAGVPDPYRGETLKAYIVLKENETLTAEEVIAYCRTKLAPYKVPRLIEFRDELPKTMVGKILRRVLVEEEKQKLQQSGGGKEG